MTVLLDHSETLTRYSPDIGLEYPWISGLVVDWGRIPASGLVQVGRNLFTSPETAARLRAERETLYQDLVNVLSAALMKEVAARTLVIIGTGGTIAGKAAKVSDHMGYRAAQIGVAELIASVPSLAALPLECEQLAQLDSKDMNFTTWQRLAYRVAEHLDRHEVARIVITHGTDTLEETAYWLHRLLAPDKPVVLTAAMRPATALSADGPQNLHDALTVAQSADARGVCVVMDGMVFHPVGLRKVHTARIDAFDAGDAGLVGRVDQARVRRFRDWPRGEALGLAAIASDPSTWPRVEIVLNHAGADGHIVDVLVAHGLDGLVVAGTGNGTMSLALAQAVGRAKTAGVRVVRASRCANGPVIAADNDDQAPTSEELSPVQARVALLLELLARHRAGRRVAARSINNAAGQHRRVLMTARVGS